MQAARTGQHLKPRFIGKRRAGRQNARRQMRKRLIGADTGIHENALINRQQQRAARRDIVKRRMEEIEAEHAKIAGAIDAVHDDFAMAPE